MPRKYKRTRIQLPGARLLEAHHDGTWWLTRATGGQRIKLRIGPGEARLLLEQAGITRTERKT